MMTRASVSVLVPCRNGERFLEETLASAVTQTLEPTEILLVDDGSTDRTREIAARFAPKVRVLDNVGHGASAARNRASQAAVGDYFQYLDADDLLEPHALESRVDALESAEKDVAISDWQRLVFRGEWQPGKVEKGSLPLSDVPADVQVFSGFWAPPAAVLYRRSVWTAVGHWSNTLPVIQDARFLFDAAFSGASFVQVPGVGAKYRQHGSGSLSTSGAGRFWNDILTNTREVEALWRARGLDELRRNRIARGYEECARVGLRHDRGLYESSRAELSRFPDHRVPVALRVAFVASDVLGFRPVSAAMALPGFRSRV